MKYYNIHNKISVIVNSDVNKSIANDINFQIGSFLVKKDEMHLNKPYIKILPYNKFKEKEYSKVNFYKEHGVVASYLNNKQEQLCVENKENNFLIYANNNNFLINLYIQLLLVNMNSTIIHACAFLNKNNKVNIFAGMGGVGKTSIIGYAVQNLGLKYLGDDIVIIDNQKSCYSFPREFVLKSYHKKIYKDIFDKYNIRKYSFSKLWRFLIVNLPFFDFVKSFLKKRNLYYSIANILRPRLFLASVEPEKIFGEFSSIDHGQIENLVYLDLTDSLDFEIQKKNVKDLSSRLLSVIHHEFAIYLPHLLSLGAMNVINLDEYFKKNSDTFNKSLEKIFLFQLKIPKNKSPEELNNFILKNNLF